MVSLPPRAVIVVLSSIFLKVLALLVPVMSKGFLSTPSIWMLVKLAAPLRVVFASPTVTIISLSRVSAE